MGLAGWGRFRLGERAHRQGCDRCSPPRPPSPPCPLCLPQAIKDGSADWASDPCVSCMFTEHARMVGADRQAFAGRPAIVRRLNDGVAQLAKMAGSDAEVPAFELGSPTPGPGGALVITLRVRRGVQRLSLSLQFSLAGGRIAHLQTTRQ